MQMLFPRWWAMAQCTKLPEQNSKISFIVQTFPKYNNQLVNHFMARIWLDFNFCDFRANFGHFSLDCAKECINQKAEENKSGFEILH